MLIKNRNTLLSHGNIKGRKLVIDILEAGITAADPYQATKKKSVAPRRRPPGSRSS